MDKQDIQQYKKSVDYIEERIIERLQGVDRAAAILDIATGKGYLVKMLEQVGFNNIHAADIHPDQFAFDPDQYHLTRVDANQPLPYADESFDVVITSETVEHLANPLQFIHEITRILKPNGRLILSTPNVQTIFSRIYYLFTGRLAGHTRLDYQIAGHIAVLPDWLIERFTQQAGLQLKDKTYNCGYIPVLRIKLPYALRNQWWGWITIYQFVKPK